MEHGEIEDITTEQLLAEFGPDAISATGKVKKYLWDEVPKCDKEEESK
jgi:hypothetical protein